MTPARWLIVAGAITVAVAFAGCGGDMLFAYTGGGLPPGEPDLGGIVVASLDAHVGTAQPTPPPGTEAIAGAHVQLRRGRTVVGEAVTGEGGYFRFVRPDTGSYTLVVTPPADRPELAPVQRTVAHTRGVQSFLTVELPRRQGR